MVNKTLNERSLELLRSLVERYIREGQPVGSKTLAQESKLMLSSASIRNIMAELEGGGYLYSPHTSAGRVPTSQGYRLFIDNFLTVQKPAALEVESLREQLGSDTNAQALVARASSLLSNITELVGIVTLPKRESIKLKLVEFLPLSRQRVLVVLVLNESEVQNRVIQTDRSYSPSDLERASNYITEHYSGMDLEAVKEALLVDMQTVRSDLDSMMSVVMDMAEQTCATQGEEDYVVAGESNLLSAVGDDNYGSLQSLFKVFSEKRDMLHLLNQSLSAKDIQIFIGEESGHGVLEDCSVVTAPYRINDKVVGVLGVIGPTRMRYQRVTAAVDATATLLSRALEID